VLSVLLLASAVPLAVPFVPQEKDTKDPSADEPQPPRGRSGLSGDGMTDTFEVAYDGLVSRGLEAGRAGRYDEAARALDSAIALGPGRPEAWTERGGVRFLEARYENAVVDLRRSLALREDAEGDTVTPGALRAARRRLEATGVFERVTLRPRPQGDVTADLGYVQADGELRYEAVVSKPEGLSVERSVLAVRVRGGVGSDGLPVDEMYAPGVSPESDLPLRAHPLTWGGALGANPVGPLGRPRERRVATEACCTGRRGTSGPSPSPTARRCGARRRAAP
jgi:hypothetical protein